MVMLKHNLKIKFCILCSFLFDNSLVSYFGVCIVGNSAYGLSLIKQ